MPFFGERLIDFVLLRLLCIAFATTWFVPDEMFQSVEIAYRMVYGIGYRTWEWDPSWALRSTLHPLAYSTIFQLFRWLHIDFGCVVRWAPNVFQALLFVISDLCYVKWLRKLGLSYNAYHLTLTLYTFNWFLLYCSTRTLSNTLECCLSIIALHWYQDCCCSEKNNLPNGKTGKPMGYVALFVSLATILRPTAVLLWAPLMLLYLWQIFTSNGRFQPLAVIKSVLRFFPFASAPLICSVFFDSIYYGSPVFCLWNFVRFNVLQGGSAQFGSHPWHWYFTQGLPPLLNIACLPLLSSFLHFRYFCLPKRYAIAAFVYIAGHTQIAHKEHRFLLPILPFLFPYIAQEIANYKAQRAKFIKYAYVILNLALAVYFGLVHQRGPNAVNSRLLGIIEDWKSDGRIKILQLMPCFSMPQSAYLHPYSNKTDIRMLTCSKDEGDEADKFHEDPEGWLNQEWYTGQLFDAHIVVAYHHIYRNIERFLMQKGFNRHSIIFHTHFPISQRQNSWIVISIRNF